LWVDWLRYFTFTRRKNNGGAPTGATVALIRENAVKSVTIVRMKVPCCGGLEMAAKKALQASGKFIPWQVVTLSLDGRIIDS